MAEERFPDYVAPTQLAWAEGRPALLRLRRCKLLGQAVENGERVYLSEDEMLTARERIQKQVEEYCSS